MLAQDHFWAPPKITGTGTGIRRLNGSAGWIHHINQLRNGGTTCGRGVRYPEALRHGQCGLPAPCTCDLLRCLHSTNLFPSPKYSGEKANSLLVPLWHPSTVREPLCPPSIHRIFAVEKRRLTPKKKPIRDRPVTQMIARGTLSTWCAKVARPNGCVRWVIADDSKPFCVRATARFHTVWIDMCVPCDAVEGPHQAEFGSNPRSSLADSGRIRTIAAR